MSNIDSLSLLPLWGDIGQIRGYVGGLLMRLNHPDLPITDKDIEYIKVLVERAEAHLAKACGYEKEKDEK